MKTPNTPENKERFFALYWGQRVIELPNLVWTGNPPEPSHEEYGFCRLDGTAMKAIDVGYDPHLELKSIADISDVDAFEVAKMIVIESMIPELDNPKQKIKWISIVRRDIEDGTLVMNQVKVDFLRSRGYLIGWMDLTPEDIIGYGWAKVQKTGKP